MGELVFVLKKGKPQSWAIGQQNIMAEKPDGKGLKYINYYKGHESIFVEDITNKDIKPSTVPDFIYNPATNKTELRFDEKDKNLYQYLISHPGYKKVFEVTSATLEAEREIESFTRKEKAIEAVNGISDNVRAAAVAVLGFDYYTKEGEECRAALKREAFNNPERVLSAINSPTFETRQIASLAFCNGVIKTSPSGTEITWANGGIILSLATGENAIDKLSLFLSEATPASVTMLQELSGRLNKKPASETVATDNKALTEAEAEIARLRKELEEAKAAKTEPSQEQEEENKNKSDDLSYEDMEIEELTALYQKETGNDVPVKFKNNKEWIASKLPATINT